MTAERDRLAALLHDELPMSAAIDMADRLIAAGVYLKREPGTYSTPEGGIEVIVDVPESASYIEDEFPDEVAYIRADLDVERLARAIDKAEMGERLTLDERDECAEAIAAAYREEAG